MDRLAQFQNALATHHVPALAELRARPVLNQSGLPHVVAGNNALVARLRRADGADVALRIVASSGNSRDWAVRYGALGELQAERTRSRLPGSIQLLRGGFPNFDSGADGDDMAIAMEWLQGPTLLQGIDRAARGGNSSVIRALSAAFIQMWNDLQPMGFVHGDYTASNVIVRSNGQIAAVDLDTASWTDAPLGPTGQGTHGYRHPVHYRDASVRDAFAALVMITSMAALADAPALRARYGGEATTIDGPLLFSRWDLADPTTSQTFQDAIAEATPATRTLIEALEEACTGDVNDIRDACAQIPRLHLPSYLPEEEAVAEAGWDVAPVVARMRAHYASTWETPKTAPETPSSQRERSSKREVRSPNALSAWEAGSATETLAVTGRDISDLQSALDRQDEVEVLRLWSRIGSDPAATLMAAEVESIVASSYDRRVLEEAKRRHDAAVLAIDEEARDRHIPLGQKARAAVRLAHERTEVQQLLDTALATGDRQQLADLAVSGQLVVLGDADRRSLQQVLQAIEWPGIQRAVETDDDLLITAAWDDELFQESNLVDPAITARVELAHRRLDWLAKARDALRRRETSTMRELLMDPPEGAAERLSPAERRRIRRSIEGQQAVVDLRSALKSGDDQAIVSALNKVERVGARVTDRATWSEIQRVVERVAIIDDLVEASEADPPDHARLAQLLPTIKALGLDHDPRLEDGNLLARMEEYVVKMAHVRRIQAAIARDNDVAIVAASVPDPRNALEMLSDVERNRVASAIKARRSAMRSHA